jgi:hypothetical protein
MSFGTGTRLPAEVLGVQYRAKAWRCGPHDARTRAVHGWRAPQGLPAPAGSSLLEASEWITELGPARGSIEATARIGE